MPDELRSTLPHPAHPRAGEASRRVRPGLEDALHAAGLRFGDPVFLRAFKEEKILEVFVRRPENSSYEMFRSYRVAAMSGTLGPKLREGDRQVPEGFYQVGLSALNPNSSYHLAFNIGYPNAFDRHHGRTGSFIMIHGGRASAGCLAMTDPAIEEIYLLCDAALRGGQESFSVHIFPFRMTDGVLARRSGGEWADFWQNLKTGHDLFEKTRTPPTVEVRDGAYRFH